MIAKKVRIHGGNQDAGKARTAWDCFPDGGVFCQVFVFSPLLAMATKKQMQVFKVLRPHRGNKLETVSSYNNLEPYTCIWIPI